MYVYGLHNSVHAAQLVPKFTTEKYCTVTHILCKPAMMLPEISITGKLLIKSIR